MESKGDCQLVCNFKERWEEEMSLSEQESKAR